jgi:hypothetical protein
MILHDFINETPDTPAFTRGFCQALLLMAQFDPKGAATIAQIERLDQRARECGLDASDVEGVEYLMSIETEVPRR